MVARSSIFGTIPAERGSLISKLCTAILPVFVIASMIVPGGVPLAHAATAPNLGAAATYSVFGKSAVSNTGAGTHVWGNVGSDALVNITGLIASQVGGSIIAPAAGIQTAITAAYAQLDAEGSPTGLDLAGTNTVVPGVYTVGATTLNGTLTLNGPGVYIFRSSSSVTVSAGATVILANGAVACDVYWQIPDAMAIGVGATMIGTIITDTSFISLATNASLVGRALSATNQVTLDTNQITEPTCVASAVTVPAASLRLQRPIISVTKIPSPLALPGPGSVTFNYEVSNPGIYAMNDVTLTDDKCSAVSYISGDTNNDSLLQTSEIWKYRCTSWLSVSTSNQARATGFANGLPATDIAYATVNVGTQLPPPLIHIVKVPSQLLLPFGGGVVTYTYTVSNPGVVGLYNVQVIDDKCSNTAYISGDVNIDNILATNETWIYTCQTNLGFTTTNTVTATGNANNETAVDVAFATVVVAPPPSLFIPQVFRASAPALPPPPAPTAVLSLPFLPNTGVGPETTGMSWEIMASGLLMALSLLFASRQAKYLLSSKD